MIVYFLRWVGIKKKSYFKLHLGELGATRASDLGDAELGELSLHFVELLEEISLGALAEFESLNLSCIIYDA